MRFSHILRIVNSEPWLIVPAAHAAIRELVERHLRGESPFVVADYKAPEMEVQEGVAIVPIGGVIGKGLSAIEKSCGACGIEDVNSNLAEALQSADVRAVLLHIDSPGGTVSGVPELAKVISAMNSEKPVVAWTDGQMDSAAYWLGCSAYTVMASESAEVGSIGVYMPWADQTKRYEQAGVKVEVIKNTGGTYKGMGIPGTALTDDQRAHLQSRVDDIFRMFSTHVSDHRPQVKPDAMRGQTFMAEEAANVGLIDRVGSLADALECASRLGAR